MGGQRGKLFLLGGRGRGLGSLSLGYLCPARHRGWHQGPRSEAGWKLDPEATTQGLHWKCSHLL